jgi:CHAT domain-containing protein
VPFVPAVPRPFGPAVPVHSARPFGPAVPVHSALRGAIPDDPRTPKSHWERQESSADEAKQIERDLTDSRFGPVKVCSGAHALEEVFKGVKSPRVLHLASHGFYLPGNRRNPEDRSKPDGNGPAALALARLQRAESSLLRSGIVLAGANKLGDPRDAATAAVDDGWVTAEEVSQMDLRGTEVVVLSACQTALGDDHPGEGVFGLRRAFCYAGAHALVMSLFVVPSDATSKLMGQFYGALRADRDKLNKLEALHAAQLETLHRRREQTGAAHPFFWAGFVLVGNPQ